MLRSGIKKITAVIAITLVFIISFSVIQNGWTKEKTRKEKLREESLIWMEYDPAVSEKIKDSFREIDYETYIAKAASSVKDKFQDFKGE